MREMRGARSRLSGEPVERRLNFDVSVAFPVRGRWPSSIRVGMRLERMCQGSPPRDRITGHPGPESCAAAAIVHRVADKAVARVLEWLLVRTSR
jgi:hypothetical protein